MMDQPYNRGELGVLYVRGELAPASVVTVTVSDGARALTKTVSSTAKDDSGAHKPAGSFNAEFGPGHFENPTGGTCTDKCIWVPGILDLGTHLAREGALPDSRSSDDYGRSNLTVTARTGNVVVTTTVAKYAATFGDTVTPAVLGTGPRLPPGRWCHNPEPVAPPDQTGTGSCAPQTNQCKIVIGPVTTNQRCSTGGVSIAGIASDADSFGIGSEIADVRLTVRQGDEILEERSILSGRRGPTARFDHMVFIDDYEPNLTTCDSFGVGKVGCYRFTVTIIDAWRHERTYDSGPVTVTPY